MKIVVCIKQVPNTDTVKIDPKTNNLVRSNVEGIINSFDRNAIEAALQLKQQAGGEVVLLSMGPESYISSLRDGLAMGADAAILLSSRKFGGADTLATGYTLAKAITKIGNVDLILFGRQSVDADTGQVGPIVAEDLQLPQITFAESVELQNNNQLIGHRLLDSVVQEVKVQLPAVVTVRSEMNQPRYETPLNIQKSFEKEITIWSENELAVDPTQIGQPGSPTIVKRIYSPDKAGRQTQMLPSDAKSAVSTLLSELNN
ncbi:electron transfer flavoprotein subunit beta [Paucilactobacillus hokkaidonensis JCM 18461]|uniref:Electron transfer flavoprotein small subunit n=2 Tax=Paucilactobacillus hokkaidonensis TaxID=1193095 RepID=A0A0A1GXB0_9LACO|nr:electron transfer flavoprotein subunit beta/FixA family protein [Paucilactobacillus hokkaidonensis]KRO09447.1 electron transfer flavoprotein subunit alpha beta [Paucilactobacillus hokkaidonensis]BAP86695.1 electron transfer flavoprotein subunit beta [Paucilactobacillus hokkaidonensis JCM 18461]